MQQTCRVCHNTFELTDRDIRFFERMGVPPPTLCPDDMAIQRMSFRNEMDLYKRTCNKTGKNMISNHPPHVAYPVIHRDVWWSDEWDPLEYGTDVDLSRPFFEQLEELDKRVPKASIILVESENCDYTNYATHNKNCYLVFGSWYDEDCMYGQSIYHSTSCMDCHYVNKCELCYECIDCNDCYNTYWSQNCSNSTDCLYLYDCSGCTNCIGCWNLRNKENYLWNAPASPSEVEEVRKQLQCSATKRAEVRKRFTEDVQSKALHKAIIGENNENVTGDSIYNSKNIIASYSVQKAEDIYYSDRTLESKDQYFCTGVHFGELAYYCLNIDYSTNVICCMNGEHHSDTAYCLDCYSVDHCFGCIGLRHKNHCILNKQYSKEEYEKLKSQIIEKMKKDKQWGEYFPLSMNPFYYNHSVAYDYFPLSKKQALSRSLHWKDGEDETLDVKKVIPGEKLPERIEDIPDDVLNWAIVCAESKQPFVITKQELAFYRKQGLPVPQLHHQTRSQKRMAKRNPRRLYNRTCSKCKKEIVSTWDPNRPEIVYCEECYLDAVY